MASDGADPVAGTLARMEELLGRMAADLADARGRLTTLEQTLAAMDRRLEHIDNQVARLERRGRF
jgi:predicted  nucleic acid-binding Zn-ribbon protein